MRNSPGVRVRWWRSSKQIRRIARGSAAGRVAAAGDNAVMESFFSLLQRNVLKAKTWGTREELTIAVISRNDRRYHRRRTQNRLDRLTPIQYETINTNTAIKAAYNCHLNIQQTHAGTVQPTNPLEWSIISDHSF